MSKKEDNSICTKPICVFVKDGINDIVKNTVSKKKRKEVYNEFYDYLLTSTGDGKEYRIEDLCSLAKTDGKNVHLWESGYTTEIAKMYNILTSSLAVLCKSSDRCNFEDMKALQLNILRETNRLVISRLTNINGQLDNVDNDLEIIKKIDIRDVTKYRNKITSIASMFGASSEYINENLIKLINSTSESTVYIISNIIRRMIDIMQRVSRMDVVDYTFGALKCYNRFLISAIGNKLTTILNSITIAGLTLGGAGLIVHAALVDTLNEQNLLQSAATFYYSSQFFEPTMQTLSAAVDLGDSIKIYLMKSFPKALEDNINTVTESIKRNIDHLANQTEGMQITDTEKNINAILDFTKNVTITDKNDENEVVEILNPALMTEEDRRLLKRYVDDNVKPAAADRTDGGPGPFGQGEVEKNMNIVGDEGTGQGTLGGGKKHKKSHKKRHQKTHKKQLKPKAKSHKKKNKPKAKSHKKK